MRRVLLPLLSQVVWLGLLSCYAVSAQTSPTTDAPTTTPKQAGSLTGRVLDPDGEPLAGVEVLVRGRGSLPQFSRRTKTDEEGNFKFTGLPAQQYRVSCYGNGISVQTPESRSALHYLGEQVTLNLIKGGVITGCVTDALGEPLVGVTVRAERLRDLNGKAVTENIPRSRQTDDRGVYRIFGLEPGVYIVHVKGLGEFGGRFGVQSPEAATYYPSTVRATAAEITVQSGAEISGIDMQHMGRRGYIISGSVTGVKNASAEMPLNLTALGLYNPANQQLEQLTSSFNGGFAFQGVSDGEYDVLAFGLSLHENSTAAGPVRVKVRGTDVSGVALKLTPLGSVSGRLLREPAACHKGELAFEEVGINAQSTETTGLYLHRIAGGGLRDLQMLNDNLPEANGEFTLRNLPAGRHFLQFNLPPGWYVKAAKQQAEPAAPTNSANTGKTKATPEIDVARTGITLKPGEQGKGLTVTLAGGAASVSGVLESKAPLPTRLRVHLIPADTAQADDLLRYAETVVEDGRFAFANLAPGKYWLFAQPHEARAGKTAWNEHARLKLRKAAEAIAQMIELKACQDVRDVRLPFAAQ